MRISALATLAVLASLALVPAVAAGPVGDAIHEVGDRVDRIEYCVEYRPSVGCVLGVEPDPVACLINQIRTGLPCR